MSIPAFEHTAEEYMRERGKTDYSYLLFAGDKKVSSRMDNIGPFCPAFYLTPSAPTNMGIDAVSSRRRNDQSRSDVEYTFIEYSDDKKVHCNFFFLRFLSTLWYYKACGLWGEAEPSEAEALDLRQRAPASRLSVHRSNELLKFNKE